MQTITFECEVITPMFLAGADGTTPELRPPSIKGALRFWWRAMNGHLSLDDLKKEEGKIFGDTEKRSAFTIQVKQKAINIASSVLVPHKSFMRQMAFQPREIFEITIATFNDEVFKKMVALFKLISCLGGIGKRSRRAMGSFKIKSMQQGETLKELYQTPNSLDKILELITPLSNHYAISGDSIRNTYQGRMQYYGWVKQIQIGEPQSQEITKIASDTSHDFHTKYKQAYEPNLGHAFKGRFASPIYVSVLGDSKKAIITTLNTVPDRGARDLDLYIQNDFKKQIL
jgi:CRISPR-associated protein Cmr1